MVLYLPLLSLPSALALTLRSFVMPTPMEALTLVGVGLLTQAGQIALTNGLQREAAGRATTVGYLQIAFAAVWGWLFFGEVPGAWSLAGAALLVGGVLLAARTGRVQRAAESAVVPDADDPPEASGHTSRSSTARAFSTMKR